MREVQTDKAYPSLGGTLELNGKRVHARAMEAAPDLLLSHESSGNLCDYPSSIASELANSDRIIIFNRPDLSHSEKLLIWEMRIKIRHLCYELLL